MIGSPYRVYMIIVYIFACHSIVFRWGELDLSHKLHLPDI